jgi:hypothetical protein
MRILKWEIRWLWQGIIVSLLTTIIIKSIAILARIMMLREVFHNFIIDLWPVWVFLCVMVFYEAIVVTVNRYRKTISSLEQRVNYLSERLKEVNPDYMIEQQIEEHKRQAIKNQDARPSL